MKANPSPTPPPDLSPLLICDESKCMHVSHVGRGEGVVTVALPEVVQYVLEHRAGHVRLLPGARHERSGPTVPLKKKGFCPSSPKQPKLFWRSTLWRVSE